MRDQRTTEIKTSKLLKSEDVNYCITAIMFNAGRKAEILDEFGFWAPGIIKEKINESFKVSFCCCAPMHTDALQQDTNL